MALPRRDWDSAKRMRRRAADTPDGGRRPICRKRRRTVTASVSMGGIQSMRNLVLRSALAGLICTAAIAPWAHAAETPPTSGGPDVSAVRALVKAKKFDAALAELKVLVVKYQHPDVY